MPRLCSLCNQPGHYKATCKRRAAGELPPSASAPEDKKAYFKARLDRAKAKGLCYRCLKNKPPKGSGRCEECKRAAQAVARKSYRNGKCRWCRRLRGLNSSICDHHRELVRRRRKGLKLRAFNAYGGPKCACCSEATSLDFLTIDHVHNNGVAHRRETKTGCGAKFYRWLIKNNFPAGYQVLCLNCNVSKHLNGGTCAHRTVTTSVPT